MNLAVRFYSDVKEGELLAFAFALPQDWPIEVLELNDSSDLPDETFVLMTLEEYEQYRADHLADYLAAVGGG